MATANDVQASAVLPDPDRSQEGAWLLAGDKADRIPDFRAANPTLRLGECYEALGAEWHPSLLKKDRENMMFYYLDPVRTSRHRIRGGVEYQGAWCTTEGKLAEAHRLKAECEDSGERNAAWSECFKRAGAPWDPFCA